MNREGSCIPYCEARMMGVGGPRECGLERPCPKHDPCGCALPELPSHRGCEHGAMVTLEAMATQDWSSE